MAILSWLILASGAYPLALGWTANRGWSLLQAVQWATLAWAVWLWALWPGAESSGAVRYLALCLTCCAIVAVLGARRPGVGAWNFVLVGLLAVVLLPVAAGLTRGRPLHLDPWHILFLGATLAVGILNYLPTRLAPAAVLLAAGCAAEVKALVNAGAPPDRFLASGRFCLAFAPWLAWAALRRRPRGAEFDRLWLGFRDRFGLLWGQRLREQFNRSAANAGWPVYLRWQGLRLSGPIPGPAAQAEIVDVLIALRKRFAPEGSGPPGPAG